MAGRRYRCMPPCLLHVLVVPRQTNGSPGSRTCGRRSLTTCSGREGGQLVAFGLISTVTIHDDRRLPVEERNRRRSGVKVLDCVSSRPVNHMQGRGSQSEASCAGACYTFTRHRSHRGAGTDHTHTFTHTHTHIDTHIRPHAFTHTEQIKRRDCTAQCGDTVTSRIFFFSLCLFFCTDAMQRDFFSPFFGGMKCRSV